MNSICFVATTPFVVNAFLLTHLEAMADQYSVTLCVNCSAYPLSDRIDSRIRVVDFKIAREISVVRDAWAFLFLLSLFRAEKFSAVHSITPKAGLLAMLAARFAGIRFRHHTFTGQVWACRKGCVRFLLKALDRVIVHIASQVFADSLSQCRFLEEERVVEPGGISVLGPGSISGVDLRRFRPDAD
ncbi:MAG: glycosyltransferase, partial [Nitrospira sp.]